MSDWEEDELELEMAIGLACRGVGRHLQIVMLGEDRNMAVLVHEEDVEALCAMLLDARDEFIAVTAGRIH